jgi:hypothetical protein
MSLRVPEGLALGVIWHALMERGEAAGNGSDPEAGRSRARRERRSTFAGAVIAVVSLLPGQWAAISQVRLTWKHHRFHESAEGKYFMRKFVPLYDRAADPRMRILTNSGMVQLRQRRRAPFVDPWLFRMQVNAGLIRPNFIHRSIEHRQYRYIITTEDLFDRNYATFAFGLPMELVEPARRHYRLLGFQADTYVYVPRDRAS